MIHNFFGKFRGWIINKWYLTLAVNENLNLSPVYVNYPAEIVCKQPPNQ